MVSLTSGVASSQDVDLAARDEQQRVTRRDALVGRAAVWAPAALVLCLGLVGLDRHSVWRDEAASLVAARRSLPELWQMLSQIESVHALYYTFLHAWLQLGDGEVWARLPSVLAMTGAAGLVGVVGARAASLPVGVVGGLLFAVNPAVSFYAQEARSTAFVALFALLATWVLLQARERRSAWWAAYALVCAVLVGLNLLAILVPVAHACTLLWWRVRRRELAAWATSTAPALLVAVGIAAASGRQPYQIGWIPRPGISSVRDFAHLTLGPGLLAVVLVAAFVLAGVAPTRAGSANRLRALALPMAGLPVAVLLTVSFVQPVFVPRHVFASVAAVALLAALGVVRTGRFVAARTDQRAVVLVAAVSVLVVGLAGVGTQRLNRTAESRPDDLAAAAAAVAAGARPGDAMVFLPGNRRLVALAYPADFAGLRDIGLADGPVHAGNLTGDALPLPVVLRNLSTSDRVWAVGRPGLALLPSESDAGAELALLDRDFVALERTGSHGVGITLYVKRPA